MKPVRKSILKLRKLKQIRRKNLEKNFLEIQMKGQDHYVFIKDNYDWSRFEVGPGSTIQGKKDGAELILTFSLSLIHISEPTRPY